MMKVLCHTLLFAAFALLLSCERREYVVKIEQGKPNPYKTHQHRNKKITNFKDSVEYSAIVLDAATGEEITRFQQLENMLISDYFREINRDIYHLANHEYRTYNFFDDCQISKYFDSILIQDYAEVKAFNFVMKRAWKADEQNIDKIAKQLIPNFDRTPEFAANVRDYYNQTHLDFFDTLKARLHVFRPGAGGESYRLVLKGKEHFFSLPIYCSFCETKMAIEHMEKNMGNPLKRFSIDTNIYEDSFQSGYYTSVYAVITELDFFKDSEGDMQVKKRILNPISYCFRYNFGDYGAARIDEK